MSTWNNIFIVLAPSTCVALLFWLIMRFIIRADRAEREAEAQAERQAESNSAGEAEAQAER